MIGLVEDTGPRYRTLLASLRRSSDFVGINGACAGPDMLFVEDIDLASGLTGLGLRMGGPGLETYRTD